MKIAFVCVGDASTSDAAFSGLARNMFRGLQGVGHKMVAVDAEPKGPNRILAAMRSFAPNRLRWRSRFRLGIPAASVRARIARNGLRRLDEQDLVLQVGASFTPPFQEITPYIIYSDWNFALSVRTRDQTHSSAHHLTAREVLEIDHLHSAIYQNASAIMTISDCVRRSFLEDYGIRPEKVFTTYAGPNLDLNTVEEVFQRPRTSSRPTILFVGKEFSRKGGDLLLRAYTSLLPEFGDLRLIVVGVPKLPPEAHGMAGVENWGVLSKDRADQCARFYQAYREADVFCLPSRLDPFPTVVREAMFFRLPCVTTNIWALPEMVEHGVTGFVVGRDDIDQLSIHLGRLLRERELAQSMGQAGRRRAEEKFTWSATIAQMDRAIRSVRIK